MCYLKENSSLIAFYSEYMKYGFEMLKLLRGEYSP